MIETLAPAAGPINAYVCVDVEVNSSLIVNAHRLYKYKLYTNPQNAVNQ